MLLESFNLPDIIRIANKDVDRKGTVFPNKVNNKCLANVKRDTCRMFRKKKRDYTKAKVKKLEENIKKKLSGNV